MLVNQTLDQLRRMKLYGLAEAFTQQLQQPDTHALSFEERFSLLADRELSERENRRLTRLLQLARLRQPACVEDIKLQTAPRPGTQCDGHSSFLRLDPHPSQSSSHWSHGHWQVLARLCPRSSGLPSGSFRAL